MIDCLNKNPLSIYQGMLAVLMPTVYTPSINKVF